MSFDELTPSENAEIASARSNGFAVYYPAFPDAKAQAERTLKGAREFNARRKQEGLGL